MIVVFYRKNIQYAKQLATSENACAFWFIKGLSSYKYIDTAIKIDSLKIEEEIYADFKEEYPELIEKYSVEIFKNNGAHQLKKATQQKMCFFASNDTILNTFSSILKYLDASDYDVYCRKNEGAAAAAIKLGITATEVDFTIPSIERYGVLILGNDWGPLERKINIDFIFKGINTVCIQESAIDFNPVYKKMRNCSFPVFQGVATLENIAINQMVTAVVGNPRFEKLTPSPVPQQKRAFVNVNFTYGIFEDYRNIWVNDVLDACKQLDIDYILSQHPRDNGDFTGYKLLKSNPLLVHDTIRESSVVISRFSALITEAIALGRPAIYYNPHGENNFYKFTPDNHMLFYATSKDELITALKKIDVIQSGVAATHKSDFLEKHLGITTQGKASAYIALLFKDLVLFKPLKKVSILQKLMIRLEIEKLVLKKIPY